MEGSKDKEHLLALKVMRLTRPALQLETPMRLDSLTCQSEPDDYNLPGFSLSPILTLPQNFGNIFLGETFSSYISVRNESKQPVTDVIVKTDLQTSSQRLSLAGSIAPPATDSHITPGQSVDDVIQHEAKELGTHILVCAVSYSSLQGEKFSFRKFFKFQVMKPLDVKTKFYNSQSDEIFLEAQVQNLTPSVIYMEKVHLDPTARYQATDLNFYDNNGAPARVHGDLLLVASMGVLQFLYRLAPSQPAADVQPTLLAVGKLDIVWRSRLGEKGRLQTSPLHRTMPNTGDVRVSLETLPDCVEVHKAFPLQVKIVNSSERSVQLKLGLHSELSSPGADSRPGAGITWLGVSGRDLGRLTPGQALCVPLRAMAKLAGLQRFESILLTDTFLNRVYVYDDLAKMFVVASDPSDCKELQQQHLVQSVELLKV